MKKLKFIVNHPYFFNLDEVEVSSLKRIYNNLHICNRTRIHSTMTARKLFELKTGLIFEETYSAGFVVKIA